MPEIKFNCTHCSQRLEAPVEMAGDSLDCPSCGKPIRIPAIEVPDETVAPASGEPSATAAPFAFRPPRWVMVVGRVCQFAAVAACLKTALFLVFVPHRPFETVKGYVFASLWCVAGAGLLRMQRWGAVALWVMTLTCPIIAFWDYSVTPNSVYRVYGATIGGGIGIALLAAIWLAVLIPGSIGAMRLWMQGCLTGLQPGDQAQTREVNSRSGLAATLVLVPFLSYFASCIVWLLYRVAQSISGKGYPGAEGFIRGLLLALPFAIAIGILFSLCLALYALGKARCRRSPIEALIYSGLVVLLVATTRAGFPPPLTLVLLAFPGVPGLVPAIWRRRACFLPMAKEKRADAKHHPFQEIKLTQSQTVCFLLFLCLFTLVNWFTMPIRTWAISIDATQLTFFANQFFSAVLPLSVFLVTVLALLVTSPRIARSCSLSADRAMVLALLYACILGWQLLFALDFFASGTVQIISPDGTASTGPALQAKAALVAVVAMFGMAVANLVKLGKWKNAVGWGLIAFVLGFMVALEV